jgi:hypothetical protein
LERPRSPCLTASDRTCPRVAAPVLLPKSDTGRRGREAAPSACRMNRPPLDPQLCIPYPHHQVNVVVSQVTACAGERDAAPDRAVASTGDSTLFPALAATVDHRSSTPRMLLTPIRSTASPRGPVSTWGEVEALRHQHRPRA